MGLFPYKYHAFPAVDLPQRSWPDRQIVSAPTWCSVDLRDGNQALIDPMGPERKKRMFKELIGMGFEEIEVGFPSASQTDYDFLRLLIDKALLPERAAIQVLTQAREHLIDKSFEAVRGARRVIMHFYNSTSEIQRRVVFGLKRQAVVDIARKAATQIREQAESAKDTEFVYEYSPESFTATELDFALEICEAVTDVLEPSVDNKLILNLPATVELSTPNLYADMIESFCRLFSRRDRVIISIHPHNDRGTAVAAAELALMAGAERVEGTLFGNGERTGNVDIVTLALNLYTQGVESGLRITDINRLRRLAEYCNQLPVHPRHPYAGELVFTAFSGSHQDAIAKGFRAMRESNSSDWDVPYLPIDPQDIGRNYQALIRINSQSGKGGVAYVLRTDHGLELPRLLQIAFSNEIQQVAEREGGEVPSDTIYQCFCDLYLSDEGDLSLRGYKTQETEQGLRTIEVQITSRGKKVTLSGEGNGPLDAYMAALLAFTKLELRLTDYHQHALTRGADAKGITYITLENKSGATLFGVGVHTNVVTASLEALTRGFNAALRAR